MKLKTCFARIRKGVATVMTACLVLSMLPAAAFAGTTLSKGSVDCGNGWKLNYSIDDGCATITGYSFSGSTATALAIPSSINGADVTTVASSAFNGCSYISTLTLPDTVKYVETAAFKSTSMTSAYVGSGIIYLDSFAFSGNLSMTTFEWGKNARPEFLGQYCFSEDKALLEMDLPPLEGTAFKSRWGDFRIGQRCFQDVTSLKKFVFEGGCSSQGSDYYDTSGNPIFVNQSSDLVVISYLKIGMGYMNYAGMGNAYYSVNFYSSKEAAEADSTYRTNPSYQVVIAKGTTLQNIAQGLVDGCTYGENESVPKVTDVGASSDMIWGFSDGAYSSATSTLSYSLDAYPVKKDDVAYACVTSDEIVRHAGMNSRDNASPNNAYHRLKADGTVDLSSMKVVATDGSTVDSSKYTLHFANITGTTGFEEHWEPLDSAADIKTEGEYAVWAQGVGEFEGASTQEAEFYVRRYDGTVVDCTNGTVAETSGSATRAAASYVDSNLKFVVMAPISSWQACLVGTALAGAGDGLCVFSDGTDSPDSAFQTIVTANTDHMTFVGPADEIGRSAIERAKILAKGSDGVFNYFDTADACELCTRVYESVKKYGPRADEPYQWGGTAVLVGGSSCLTTSAVAQYCYANSAPVFFTAADGSVPEAVLADLADFGEVVVAGGEGLVPDSAVAAVEARGCTVKRIMTGDTALSASTELAESIMPSIKTETAPTVSIANAAEPADVMAAAQYAALNGGVTFAVSSSVETKQLQEYLVASNSDDINYACVVGDFSKTDSKIIDRVKGFWTTPLSTAFGVGDTFESGGVLYTATGASSAELTRVLDAGLASVSCGQVSYGGASYSVSSVDAGAFRGRAALASVDLGSAASSVPASMFAGCSSLASVSAPAAASVGASAFAGCASLESATLPSCSSVGASAFEGCSSLASVSLGAASIGARAFAGCTSLKSAPLASCSSVGTSAFSGCTSLKKLALGASSIGASAFAGCSSLASATLSSRSLKSLGAGAFRGCSKLKSLVIRSKRLSKAGSGAMAGTPAKLVVKCPKAKVKKYRRILRKAGMKAKAKVKKA